MRLTPDVVELFEEGERLGGGNKDDMSARVELREEETREHISAAKVMHVEVDLVGDIFDLFLCARFRVTGDKEQVSLGGRIDLAELAEAVELCGQCLGIELQMKRIAQAADCPDRADLALEDLALLGGQGVVNVHPGDEHREQKMHAIAATRDGGQLRIEVDKAWLAVKARREGPGLFANLQPLFCHRIEREGFSGEEAFGAVSDKHPIGRARAICCAKRRDKLRK